MHWKSNVLQDAPRSCVAVFSRFVLVNYNNVGPVCIAMLSPR